MKLTRFASAAVLALCSACSEDEASPPTTSNVNSNQPASSSGGAAGAAGAAGTSAAAGSSADDNAAGGSSPEAPGGDIDLDPGESEGPTGAGAGVGADASVPPPALDAGGEEDTSMSFFVTSRGSGDGGNFGGLVGADAFCTSLAAAVSPELGQKTWRAYLSTSSENARDRIGTGPWRNAAGVVIGTSVEQLHDQTPGPLTMATAATSETTYPFNDASTALDETGAPVPDNPVLHDIITGSNLDGTVSAAGTCSDWTSATGTTTNGHSNRTGFGTNYTSWNSAHDTGCGEPDPGANFQENTVSQGGGRGSIYCFAL